MLSQKHRASSVAKTYKFAQSANFLVRTTQPPKGTVLDDVLKTVERQLQSRGLLPSLDADAFHPLWFLAETERNVFLWRHGFSLADHAEFEFWLDPRALLEKRRRQLERAGDNPFASPEWGRELAEPAPREEELSYLHAFAALLGRIEAHAHALSIVASLLQAESRGERDRILLPIQRRDRSAQVEP